MLIVMPLPGALPHSIDRPARTRFRVRTRHSTRLAAVSLRADEGARGWIATVAKRSLAGRAAGDYLVAVALVSSGEVATIALKECNCRGAGLGGRTGRCD
jgi:hypothetical protein